MNPNTPVVIVISTFKEPSDESKFIKCLVSTLGRTLGSVEIILFSSGDYCLFRVPRANVTEVDISLKKESGTVGNAWLSSLIAIRGLSFEPDQWVLLVDAATIILRNIDHLLPEDIEGPFAPAKTDFYYVRHGVGNSPNDTEISPGFWAIRWKYFEMACDSCQDVYSRNPQFSDVELFSSGIANLSFRKKQFEKGEVVAPGSQHIDWDKIHHGAVVTVPLWEPSLAWKFIQSLYLVTVLGDESGMMLNILEP